MGHRDDEQLALITRCPLNTQFFNVSDARVRVNSQEFRRLLAGPGVRPPDPVGGNPACRSPRGPAHGTPSCPIKAEMQVAGGPSVRPANTPRQSTSLLRPPNA